MFPGLETKLNSVNWNSAENRITSSLTLLLGPLEHEVLVRVNFIDWLDWSVWKLLELDRNTWNHMTVGKLLVLDRNTWNILTVFKLFVLRIAWFVFGFFV